MKMTLYKKTSLSYQKYLSMDNLQCFDTNENFEVNIVEFIKGKHQQLGEGNDDDDDLIVLVTNKKAKKYIAGLQQYFIQVFVLISWK